MFAVFPESSLGGCTFLMLSRRARFRGTSLNLNTCFLLCLLHLHSDSRAGHLLCFALHSSFHSAWMIYDYQIEAPLRLQVVLVMPVPHVRK